MRVSIIVDEKLDQWQFRLPLGDPNFKVAFPQVDIPPQPRGIPRIEVSFDIDANGILNVSACDQKTGKEQRFVVNPTRDLSAAEVQRIIDTAASQSESDRRRVGAIKAAAALTSLAQDVMEKVAEFGKQLPPTEAQQMTAHCRKLLGETIEAMKKRESLEEIMQMNRDLQEQALALFKKASRKVGGCQPFTSICWCSFILLFEIVTVFKGRQHQRLMRLHEPKSVVQSYLLSV